MNILNLIGNTPLVKIEDNFYAKLESMNPSGSIKDRVALYLIEKAEREGKLKKGYKIIEATSGNMGISLAMVSALKGYSFTAIMPKKMSIERRKMIQVYGSSLVIVSNIKEARKKLLELEKQSNVFLPRQFENPANIDCHRETTGKEILAEIGNISCFVAGVGTGGTLMGVAEALRTKFPFIQIVAVEPIKSPIISQGKVGIHKIQGIGSGIPNLIDKKKINKVIKIKDSDAIKMSSRLARELGLFVGYSSGANVLASLQMRKYSSGNIITVLPDSGNRYLTLK